MPELKSKKSGRTWKDPQSFYNDYVKEDPSAKEHSPDDLWEAARTSGGYDFADDVQQPAVTQPPPVAGKPFDPVQMAKNWPDSFGKQAKDMGTGIVKVARLVNPGGLADPESLSNRIVENPSNFTPSSMWQGVKNAASAIKQDYSKFYTGGQFLENLEQDPARVLADAASLIPIIGWGAKAAGLSKTASTLGKIATVADAASSPMPAIGAVARHIPPISNKLAKKSMTYALHLPAGTEIDAGERLANFALNNKINMSMKGRAKAKAGFEQANNDMIAMEVDATGRGVDIDPTAIRAEARSKIRKGNEALTKNEAKANKMVDEIIDDPKNYASGPVSPIHAAGVRRRLNAASKPKPGTIHNNKEGLQSQAFLAVGDATRSQLGNAMPGYRDTSLRAMDFHDAYESADRVQRGLRNSSIVDNAQPGAIGSSVGNIFKGNVFSPVVAGTVVKTLHTPDLMSRAAIIMHYKDPSEIGRIVDKARRPVQAISNVLKQAGKPNPLRPFAEDDEPKPVNPLRPFQE